MTIRQYNNPQAHSSTNRKHTNKTIINKTKVTATMTNNSTTTVNNSTTTTSNSSMKNLRQFTRRDPKPLQLLMLNKLRWKKITVTNKRHMHNNLYLLKNRTQMMITHIHKRKSKSPHNSRSNLFLPKIKTRMMIILINKLKSKVQPSSWWHNKKHNRLLKQDVKLRVSLMIQTLKKVTMTMTTNHPKSLQHPLSNQPFHQRQQPKLRKEAY